MTKCYNFVKKMIIKNPKPHAHLQIMAKNSAKFKIKLIKDVAGVAGTRSVSKDHNSIKNGQTKIKKNAHLHIIRKQSTKFHVNLTKDVGGVAGTRFRTDGRKEIHTHTNKGHFYSPTSPTLGDKNT